jgi:hypothetical protein
MNASSRSLLGEKEPPMRLSVHVRVVVTSLLVATASLVSFVASALANTPPGPIPK